MPPAEHPDQLLTFYKHLLIELPSVTLFRCLGSPTSTNIFLPGARNTVFIVITRVHRALRHETPEKKWILREAISRPFAIAIRAARLYTAWLRYRSYVVVGLKTSIPTIQECLFSSAARSKQDEVALLRSQGSFRTLLTSLCSTRPYL